MWWKFSFAFFSIALFNTIFVGITFYFLDNFQTKSYWPFLFSIIAKALPLILLANCFYLWWYSKGYEWFGGGEKVWSTQIIIWAAGPFSFVLMAYFWRGELPTKGALAGLFLCAVGAVINIVWK